MRFVIYGAGAIGGLIGARLHALGQDVQLIARGDHLAAIRGQGLTVRSAEGEQTYRIPAVGHPAELRWAPNDVVLLCVKSQDTPGAVAELVSRAPADTALVCVQNGVANERTALRFSRRVYACLVICPGEHLQPGVVRSFVSDPVGILDIGRYPPPPPGGTDETHGAAAITAALTAAGFDSQVRPDVMRWKYRKLLLNIGNAVKALCGPAVPAPTVRRLLDQEAEACLHAAGIAVVPAAEFRVRQRQVLDPPPGAAHAGRGGSSWQSLQRRTGQVETDYLNGEIVLLGREHQVPTPMNEVMQRMLADAARMHGVGSDHTEDELLAMLPGASPAVPDARLKGRADAHR
jgi:2-dehydropantoate 2-reductase